MAEPPDRLIRDRDVAAIYSINRSSVWRWVERELIPPPIVKRDKFTRWSMNQVQAHIEQLKKAQRDEEAS